MHGKKQCNFVCASNVRCSSKLCNNKRSEHIPNTHKLYHFKIENQRPMSFPSVLVIVCGFVYSLMFCVVAHLDGIDGVRSFLSGSESFLRRLIYEYLAEVCRALEDLLPKVLLVIMQCAYLVASSIMFVSDRLSSMTDYIIRESASLAPIVIFTFFVCSLIWNYEEAKECIVAVVEIIGTFLAAVFSIVNDPSKLATAVLLLSFPQILSILQVALLKA